MEEIIMDTKVNIEVSGNRGRPVILLHGWGQNTTMMKPIADHLKSDFICYNFDFPGFGKSEIPKSAWGVEEYTQMLRAFIEKNEIEDPIIIAHSFGARVAILYASQYPVYKMVITGGAGIRPKRDIGYYVRTYAYKLAKLILSLPGLGRLKEELTQNAGSEDYRALDGVMRESFVKIVNLDLSDCLEKVDCEVLLVWGENDDATPLWMGEKMERMMPNAGLAVFEQDGHYAYFNQIDRFNSVLDVFFEGDKL